MFPPLPTCTAQQAGETLPEYAARVLRHLLATDCTATLTDEQLSQADTAAQLAAAQLHDDEGRASRLDSAQLHTVETLSASRRMIALVLDWRRQDDQRRATGPLIQPSQHPQPGTQGGRPAPLNPPPPRQPGSPDALVLPRSERRPADGIRF